MKPNKHKRRDFKAADPGRSQRIKILIFKITAKHPDYGVERAVT